MRLDNAVDWCKRVWLRRVVQYGDQRRYWDRRWRMGLKPGSDLWANLSVALLKTKGVMEEHGCTNLLEIGCGPYPLKGLQGYIGMDFSQVALSHSGLQEYICADVTKRIPLPDKSIDAVYLGNVMLHIPSEKVERAAFEIMRVARKCIIVAESRTQFESNHECYWHDLEGLFKGYSGELVMI